MAVVRRGNVWQVQVRVGKDPRTGKWVRKSATADTREEAETIERRLLAEAESNRARFVEPTRLTVEQYMAEWLDRKRVDGAKAKTLYDYGMLVKRCVVPGLGKVILTDVSPVMVQRWQDRLADRPDAPGATQAAYAHRVLRAALNDAVRLGMLPANPAQRARPAQRSRRKREGYTLQQAEALFAAAPPRWAPLFRFLFFSGLRPGEALALRWSDVDRDAGIIHVRRNRVSVGGSVVEDTPKTEAGLRTFKLAASGSDALTTQWALQAQDRLAAGTFWQDADWVFATRLGAPLERGNVSRAYRDARLQAGLPETLPMYSLRHGTASVLLGSGVPLGVAAKMMGHGQVAVFADTYAKLVIEASTEAAQKVDAFLAEHGKAPDKRNARRRGRPRGKQ